VTKNFENQLIFGEVIFCLFFFDSQCRNCEYNSVYLDTTRCCSSKIVNCYMPPVFIELKLSVFVRKLEAVCQMMMKI